jgi:hypothetical protein
LKNDIDSSGVFTVERFATKGKAVFVKILVSHDDPYIRFAIVPKTNGDEYRQSQGRQYTDIAFFLLSLLRYTQVYEIKMNNTKTTNAKRNKTN